jgi:hypothetical protein
VKSRQSQPQHRKPSHYSWLVPSVTAIVAVLVVSSCSKQKPQPSVVSTESQARDLSQQAQKAQASGDTAAATQLHQQASDKYARLGELLLMPEGLQYADQMFDLALQENPKSAKANLYKAETGIMMTGQGFLSRIERLVVKDKDVKALEEVRQKITDYKQQEVNDFATVIPAGENPFVTYYDVQRWEREKLLPAVLAAVDHLSQIDATNPIELNLNPARLSMDPTRSVESYSENTYESSCYNDPQTGWTCNEYNSSHSGTWSSPQLPTQYFLDRHDIKIFHAAYVAIANTIRIGTAYSQKDIEFVIRRLRAIRSIRSDDREPLTPQDITGVLMEFPALLTLESDNQLSLVAQSSTEALKDGLELASLRTELCEGKGRTAKNSLIRPICIAADEADALQMGVDLLAGPTQVNMGIDPNGAKVMILTDVTQILTNSPKDLKAFLPTSFDDNGYPVVYPDPTMGGLFPNGDVIKKFGQLSGSLSGSYQNFSWKASSSVRQLKDHL